MRLTVFSLGFQMPNEKPLPGKSCEFDEDVQSSEGEGKYHVKPLKLYKLPIYACI